MRTQVALALLAIASGCRFELTEPLAQVTCSQENPTCPTGFICHPRVGLCLRPASSSNPPTLVVKTLRPAVAKRGDTVTAAFTVSSELAVPPTVLLLEAGRSVEATLTPNGLDFQATWLLSESDHEGVARVSVDLVGRDGTESLQQPLGDLTLDFTAPSVISGSTRLTFSTPNSLASRPAALGVGGELEVEFALDEPGTATIASAPTSLDFTLTSSTSTGFAYRGRITTSVLDGPQTLTVTTRDSAGNTGTTQLSTQFIVDQTAPQPPATLAQQVVYRRVSSGPEAQRGDWVQGTPASVEPDVELVATDARGLLVGRGRSDTDGGFSVSLAIDPPVVFLQAIDVGGNSSAKVDVKNVEWVASVVGRVPHNAASNTNWLEATPTMSRAMPLVNSTEVAVPAVAKGVRRWTRGASTFPFGTEGTLAVTSKGEVAAWVDDSSREYTGLWTFNDETWSARIADGEPTPRSAAALASDGHDRLALFGGWVEIDVDNDFAFFDGTRWSRPRALVSPPGLANAQMSFDTERQRLVLFGGRRSDTSTTGQLVPSNSLWEWDGLAWADRSPSTGARPNPVYLHAMTYDAARHVTVVFGGTRDESIWNSETWEWNGATWTPRMSARSPPGLRNPRLSWDRSRGVSVLMGYGSAGIEVWEWDGSAWTNRTPSAPTTTLGVFSAAWDQRAQRVVVLRQTQTHIELADWNGTAFTPRHAPPLPTTGAHICSSMLEDPAQHTVLLVDPPSVSSWDGIRWSALDAGTTVPTATCMKAAFDASRSRVVATGGYEANGNPATTTWEWDGRQWVNRGPSPPLLGSSTLVWSPASQNTLARGRSPDGGDDGILWAWDGTGWSLSSDGTGFDCRSSSMAFDVTRNQVVAFGVSATDAGAVTCLFTEDAGWQSTPTDQPEGRVRTAMAFDSARSSVVMLGGALTRLDQHGTPLSAEGVWRWAGHGWGAAESERLPALARATAVHDSARDTLLVAPNAPARPRDWWALGLARFERPGVVAHFPFVPLQLDDTPVMVEIASIAGGSGAVGRTSVAGATLLRADETLGFVELASNSATQAAPETLKWATTDPAVLSSLFIGATRELVVAFTPMGTHLERQPATVAVDDVQVTVKWRRP